MCHAEPVVLTTTAASFPWATLFQLGVGSLSTLAVQAFLNNKKASETAISDHILDVLKLREVAMDFWLRDGAGDPEKVALEVAPVHAAFAAVRAFADMAGRTFGVRAQDEYRCLLSSLNREVTGGYFDSINRRSCPATAVEIARLSALLAQFLRQHRSSLHAFHRMRQYADHNARRSLSNLPYRAGLRLGSSMIFSNRLLHRIRGNKS